MSKYFFLHIPKTAGSSLFTYFRSVLGEEEVFQARDISIGKKRAEAIKSYKLIGGHITFTQMTSFFKDRYAFTFLRNPVDRFLSMYYFFRSVEEVTKDETVEMAKKLDLKDYIEWISATDEHQYASNGLIWYLTGDMVNIPIKERLELAKQNLKSLNFVGITEKFEESLDLFCIDCYWPPKVTLPRENVTPHRQNSNNIDKALLIKLKEILCVDLELYEFALKLYEQKKREILRECIQSRYQEELDIDNPEIKHTSEVKDTLSIAIREESNSIEDIGSREIEILAADVYNINSCSSILSSGEEAVIRIIILPHINEEDLTVGISIKDDYDQIIYGTNSYFLKRKISVQKEKIMQIDFRLKINLNEGHYHVVAALHTQKYHLDKCYHWKEYACNFIVSGFSRTYFQGFIDLQPELFYCEGKLSESLPTEVAEKISVHINKVPEKILRKTRFNVNIYLVNKSSYDLSSYPPYPVQFSYHWYKDQTREVVIFDGDRSLLINTLKENSDGNQGITVLSPQEPGEYILRITLVQEMVFWFDQVLGHKFAECKVKVI